MFCSKCGNQPDGGERFCRKCGANLRSESLVSRRSLWKRKSAAGQFVETSTKDPDELSSNGIGSVMVGDGFFMVAIILSASLSSVLWLLLLIPAFFFFGKGLADLLHARQIYRRRKQSELSGGPATELPAAPAAVDDIFNHSSGKLITTTSVTERTTRQLK